MKQHDHEAAWEALCEQCGLCCFEKYEDDAGTIFFTRTPCRYLDVVTRRCTIYDRRFDINPECIQLTEELVREIPWLHDECGYRKALGITCSKVRLNRTARRTAKKSKES